MLFVIATIIALAALTNAAPRHRYTSIPLTKRSSLTRNNVLDVDALNAHVSSVKSQLQRGFDNYQQNTGKAHPLAGRSLEKRGASDPLTDDGNNMWYGPIQVGTPGKTFTVKFDALSADTFIPSHKCFWTCRGHKMYKPSDSSTSADLHKKFTLYYGLDEAMVPGDQYSDVFNLAGFQATEQSFIAASTYPSDFKLDNYPADGLLGMAFESISTMKASPLFETLIDQKGVPEPSFSFKLSDNGAELYVGGANPTQYKGDFAYTPVTTEGFWQVDMDSLQVNGQTLLLSTPSIISPGTTVVIGRSTDVERVHKSLGGEKASIGDGYYSYKCDDMPTISLSFGNTSFQILPEALDLGTDPGDDSRCVSGIVSSEDVRFWVVGDVFLRSVYTTFDFGGQRVGFAQLAD